jgi:serine O-acetyltransferase
MRTSLGIPDLAAYVAGQIGAFFPDRDAFSPSGLEPWVQRVWPRVEHCFQHVRRKYFVEDGEAVFSHRHSDHYAMFLYLLSNTVHRGGGPVPLAEKLFLLNKALHGLDCYYAVELPPVFLFIHPVGTVLGNARYGDYLVVYQNVSVGADIDGVYPAFGRGVVLFSKSSVLGACEVGADVVLGAGAFVLNAAIPDRSIVVGTYPHHRVIGRPVDVVRDYFHQR